MAVNETDFENIEKAYALYQSMINNYNWWQRGGVGDRKSKVDFENAARLLAKMNMPNPWEEACEKARKEHNLQMNAAVKPDGKRVVTGVAEKKEMKEDA